MSFEDFEKQLDDLEKTVKNNFQDNNNENDDNEDSSDEANELYCVACNKSFKSDKAYENLILLIKINFKFFQFS